MSRSRMHVNKNQPKKGSLKTSKPNKPKPKTPPKPQENPRQTKQKKETSVSPKTAKLLRPYIVHKERKQTQKSGNQSLKMKIASFLTRKRKNKSSNNYWSNSNNNINSDEAKLIEKAKKKYKDKRLKKTPKFKLKLLKDKHGIKYMGNVTNINGNTTLLPPKKVVTKRSKLGLKK